MCTSIIHIHLVCVYIYCYMTKINATLKVEEERETHDLTVAFLSDHKVH